jgi:hypothetical protein
VVELPASTRALGMGNAYALASSDNDAIFYNPGLLDTSRGIGASAAFYDRATLFTISGAAEWWRGGVGLGIQSVSWSAAGTASGAFSRGEAGLSDGGPISASETAASAAYARVIKGFRVGVAGKLIDLRMPGERDVTAAADLGIARRLGPVTLGLAAQNLGRAPEITGFDLDLPLGVTLGASVPGRPLGPLDVTAAAAVSAGEDERLEASAGLELGYWPISGRTFFARVGFRHVDDSDIEPLTLGAGFAGDRIVIDYAFQNFDDGSPVHRVGLRWR